MGLFYRKKIAFLLICLAAGASSAADRLDAQALYAKACNSFAGGDYRSAAGLLSEFHSRYNDEPAMSNAMPRVTRLLGCSWYSLGDMPKAVEYFEVYLAYAIRDQWYPVCLFQCADAYSRLDRSTDALEQYHILLKEFPGWEKQEDVWYQVAVCHLMQNQFDKALPVLRRLKEHAVNPQIKDAARAWRVKCLYEAGKHEEALQALLDCISSGGSRYNQVLLGSVAIALGDWYFSSFDYSKALDAYRCVIRRNEIMRQQEETISELSRKQKRYAASGKNNVYSLTDQARTAALLAHCRAEQQRIKHMNDFDTAFLMRLGLCLYDMGRLWEACIVFKEIKQAYPAAAVTETARVRLIYCLSQMRLYDQAIKEIDEFKHACPDNPAIPTIAFLKAEAYLNREDFLKAEKELLDILAAYPDFSERERAAYYVHLSQAMQEKFVEARSGLEDWLGTAAHSNSVIKADAEYWYAMVLFFSQDYSNALQRMLSYSAQYPRSPYCADIAYRIGVIYYMQEQYRDAAMALMEYIKGHPLHGMLGEARALRGDALAAMGYLERAVKAYREITPENGPHFNYSVAQQGKCLRALKNYPEMIKLYTAYTDEVSGTPPVVEGLYWLGWAYRQVGDLASARNTYWHALKKYGNCKEWEGFQDIAKDLHRLYAGSNGTVQLMQRLREESGISLSHKQITRASRFDIVRFRIFEAQGEQARMSNIVDRFITMYTTNQLGADGLAFAGRRLHEKKDSQAYACYKIIIDEFPESSFIAEAYLRCAQYEGRRGDREKQHALLKKAEASVADMKTALEITMEQAEYSRAAGMLRQAITHFESVLANRAARGPLWPKALDGIAASYQELGEYTRAIPYYQRVYVMYGAYTALAARAYLNSGACFEYLHNYDAAIKTYTELLDDTRLAGCPETQQARKRLLHLRQTVTDRACATNGSTYPLMYSQTCGITRPANLYRYRARTQGVPNGKIQRSSGPAGNVSSQWN